MLMGRPESIKYVCCAKHRSAGEPGLTQFPCFAGNGKLNGCDTTNFCRPYYEVVGGDLKLKSDCKRERDFVMEDKKNNRSKWLHLRLTEEELRILQKRFNASTYRKFSEYTRQVILSKPVIAGYKDQSLDEVIAVLSVLRKDLNGVANNFNQVVHKLHTLDHIPEYRTWLRVNEQDRVRDRMSVV